MFMKRFFSLAAALVLLAGALCAPAAYCYAQDPIADPEVAQRMEGLIPMVLEAIYGEDEPPVSTVSLDRAVRTYRISYEAFLEAVDRDILDLAWEEAGYVWKLPVYMDEETGAYALATVGGTGSSYTTSSYPGDNFGMHDYVFYPQQTLDILREAGVSQAADIYVLSLSGVKLDFVVAEEPDGEMTLLPYSSRPDFLGMDNGVPLTPQQAAQTMQDYLEENGGTFLPGGGGAGFDPRPYLLLPVALFAVVAVVYVVRCLKKRPD